MARSNEITILLTLRGRHLHTLRWLWYANEINFPYHVIIADGEVHPTIDRLLSNRLTFPNLSYEYHRYSDASFSDFYMKCVDASKKVKTKYVMMSDNDDYPIVTGIEQSIAYLNIDASYVAAGGKIPFFSIDVRTELSNQVFGKMNAPRFTYGYRCHDLSSDFIGERVLDEARVHQVLYYHVFRTQTLGTIFEEIQVHDFSDLTVFEYFHALRTATLGKVRIAPSVVCYLRQSGTSSNSSGISLLKDWVHHLLHSRLPQDFRVMALNIANAAEGQATLKANELKECILDAYAENLRHYLGHTMMRHRFPRLFQIKQNLLWIKKIRWVPFQLQKLVDQNKFWHEMSTD